MGIVEGGLIAIVCFVLGRYLPSRKEVYKPLDQQPVCGCKHHFAYHDPEAGECHGTVKTPTSFSIGGAEVAWKQVPCTCRRYAGPEPLPSVIDMGITGGPQ